MASITPVDFQDYANYGAVATQNKGTDNVVLTDGSGHALVAHGTTVPTDAQTGYATGCLYMKTDGGAGTSLYVNEGTTASCDFNALAGA